MSDGNALFDDLLEACRHASDPERFRREIVMRLEDSTTNAVTAAERKLAESQALDPESAGETFEPLARPGLLARLRA